MKIYLVRHGETDWNQLRKWQGHTDIDLNETGVNQAMQLSKNIGNFPNISIIYVSPLTRACKTAEILNRALNVEVVPRDGLKEVGLGVWEGMKYDDVLEHYPIDFKLWNSHIDGMDISLKVETLLELQNRAFSELEELRKQTPNDFMIVGHGAWISTLLCKLLNTEKRNGLIHIENASLLEIEYDKKSGQYIVITDF